MVSNLFDWHISTATSSSSLFVYMQRMAQFVFSNYFLHKCKCVSAYCRVQTLYILYIVHSCCYNGFSVEQNNPQKLPLPLGVSGPPHNAWFLGFTQVHNSNGTSIGSSIFVVSNRPQIDHATSIARDCIFAFCACDAA